MEEMVVKGFFNLKDLRIEEVSILASFLFDRFPCWRGFCIREVSILERF